MKKFQSILHRAIQDAAYNERQTRADFSNPALFAQYDAAFNRARSSDWERTKRLPGLIKATAQWYARFEQEYQRRRKPQSFVNGMLACKRGGMGLTEREIQLLHPDDQARYRMGRNHAILEQCYPERYARSLAEARKTLPAMKRAASSRA